jgi:hypothetical protein
MTEPVTRRGFSVRVFLPDGDPDGLKVVEKSNWTGAGLVIPRSIFGSAQNRPELTRAGVYILAGQDESSALPLIYIGEGDPVGPRLKEHALNKDFWTHAVAFTSKDTNLNKAHVQRLEAELVRLAQKTKRSTLENRNVPQPPSLSEADTAEVDGFLDDILLCLPLLGYGFFEGAPSAAVEKAEFQLSAKGVKGQGYESTNGFVVRAGSTAVKEDKEAPSMHDYLRALRAELVSKGVFEDDGDFYQLNQDYSFSSPSAAASVLLGNTANGRMLWINGQGQTLKAVQDAELGL